MKIVVDIPDDLVKELVAEGQDPSRAVLEAVALEGYRRDQLSEEEIRRLLGFDIGLEVHGFFKDHEMPWHYSKEDLANDLAMAHEDARRSREDQRRSTERIAG